MYLCGFLLVLLLFDTEQARIWRWLPQSARQSEFSKKFRLEETVWRTTKPEKKRNGGSGKKPRKNSCGVWVSVRNDIEKLRVHDWAIFNSDRRYYQRMQETGTYLEEVAADMTQPEIKTVEDFLDNIENQQLYQVLIKVDRLTLHIAFIAKYRDILPVEIACRICGITENSRLQAIRTGSKQKIQKIFEIEGKIAAFPRATG